MHLPIKALCQLMRFDKPIGIVLLLWPTLWGLWIAAQGCPPLSLLGIFIAGVVVMRAAGCVINDIADKDIDGRVARTKERPLAKGVLKPRQAWVTLAVLLVFALGLLLLLPPYCWWLAPIGLLIAMVYPLTKRFFQCPQLCLAIAFNWGIVLAFAAQHQHVPPLAWLLFFVSGCWTIAYDTLYAMSDRPDDLTLNIHSSAILFGRYDRGVVGILQGMFLVGWGVIATLAHLGTPVMIALVVVLVLFIHQQYRVRSRDREACFRAFLANHWVGLVMFLGLLIAFMGKHA